MAGVMAWSAAPGVRAAVMAFAGAVGLFVSCADAGDAVRLESVGIRGGFSGPSLFGEDHPKVFHQYDVLGTIGLPWNWYSDAGWGVSTKVIVSTGVLRSWGETNFIGTIVPALTFGPRDEQVTLTLGGGGAILSDHKWGPQNFGGVFQYVAAVGLHSRVFGPMIIGYWLQHYSDAAMYGRGERSRGADMHLFELSYRF